MALFVLSLCPFYISVGVGAFVIGLGQISSFLSLSKQKCYPLLNGVSAESQKRTSVRQIRQDFSPTRNMTRYGLNGSFIGK